MEHDDDQIPDQFAVPDPDSGRAWRVFVSIVAIASIVAAPFLAWIDGVPGVELVDSIEAVYAVIRRDQWLWLCLGFGACIGVSQAAEAVAKEAP